MDSEKIKKQVFDKGEAEKMWRNEIYGKMWKDSSIELKLEKLRAAFIGKTTEPLR